MWGKEVKKGNVWIWSHFIGYMHEMLKNKEKSYVCIHNRPNCKLEKVRIVL